MHVESLDITAKIAELQSMARIEVAQTLALAPFAVLGTVAHAPIMALAHVAGRRLGVDPEGDISVEATFRIIAGFVGKYYTTSMQYPGSTLLIRCNAYRVIAGFVGR